MQFRGVSHALSATAMRTSYFGSGYARKMQNSFYPRRSGDVIINLMPGWIEEHDHKRSSSGSMYGYDTRVPLIFYGAGILPRQIDRPVDMTAVAPTLCVCSVSRLRRLRRERYSKKLFQAIFNHGKRQTTRRDHRRIFGIR